MGRSREEVKFFEFVRTVGSEQDLGRESTTFERILEFLGGSKPPIWQLAERMGLAVSDDGNRLCVSDFAQPAFHPFDFGTKTFTAQGEDKPLKRPIGIALDARENVYVVEQDRDVRQPPKPCPGFLREGLRGGLEVEQRPYLQQQG